MSKISDDLYIKVPRNLIYNEYEDDNIKISLTTYREYDTNI